MKRIDNKRGSESATVLLFMAAFGMVSAFAPFLAESAEVYPASALFLKKDAQYCGSGASDVCAAVIPISYQLQNGRTTLVGLPPNAYWATVTYKKTDMASVRIAISSAMTKLVGVTPVESALFWAGSGSVGVSWSAPGFLDVAVKPGYQNTRAGRRWVRGIALVYAAVSAIAANRAEENDGALASRIAGAISSEAALELARQDMALVYTYGEGLTEAQRDGFVANTWQELYSVEVLKPEKLKTLHGPE